MLHQLQVKDIRLLQMFCQIVDANGISAAQEALGMTQSNISMQLQDLESRLGIRLCERGRKGFRVTEEGQQVYATAHALMADLGDYQDQLQSIGQGLRGELLIGHMDNYISHPENQLINALQELTRLSRDIHYNLRTASMHDLEQKLDSSDLQIALGTFRTFHPEMEYQELHQETEVLCCASHHILAKKKGQINQEDLVAAGFASASFAYDQESELLQNRVATVHQLESMLAFVMSGRGVGYLPDHVVAPWVTIGQLIVLAPDQYNTTLPVYLAVRRKSTNSPLVRRFVNILLGLHGAEKWE